MNGFSLHIEPPSYNVPPDVSLCDTFNLAETTLLSIILFFSNAMHACLYVHITVRLIPCFISI